MALKVLTVDDSKTIRMIVKKAFKPYDCVMFEAENGVDGLSLATREKPDLIVLDITMPIMNGIEMLEKLKHEPGLKDVPVIMLTAESGQDNVMRIVKMGVRDYMVKPFKGEQLIERARNIVALSEKKDEKAAGDASKRYFRQEQDVEVLTLPEKINRPVIAEVEGLIKPKLDALTQAGRARLVLDLSRTGEVNMALIKLIIVVGQACQNANVGVRMVGTPALQGELQGFQETSHFQVHDSVAAAVGSF